MENAVHLAQKRKRSELEQQGIIQSFEYTHELAWNALKDYLFYQGDSSIKGSGDATRAAFKVGLITNGAGWMDMIRSRNKATHTYNKETADEIYQAIIGTYYQGFKEFQQTMASILKAEQGEIFNKP